MLFDNFLEKAPALRVALEPLDLIVNYNKYNTNFFIVIYQEFSYHAKETPVQVSLGPGIMVGDDF